MAKTNTHRDDPMWPTAAAWLARGSAESGEGMLDGGMCDVGIIGVPAHETSISPTRADTTPAAVRAALAHYSTYAASRGIDVGALDVRDFGDVDGPDGQLGEERVHDAIAHAAPLSRLLVALGGDNSITFSVASALFAADGVPPTDCGLITLDAHHDVRDGISNGSPVRRLVEAGVPAEHIVQIGIADFSNSSAYSTLARGLGITIITRDDLRREPIERIAERALAIAGEGGRPVYVDLDVDVCDLAEVPGCPAAAPGGISADMLRHFAFLLARAPHVRAIDIVEVDAKRDAADGRTVRLAALLLLEAAAGLAAR